MSESYYAELCAERHKVIDNKMELHDKRLNDHGERLKKLEQRSAAVDEIVENLCEQQYKIIHFLVFVST